MNASKTATEKTARAKTETTKVKADANADADASKESKYKISVIIPVYNAEKTLERAFLSVKNQTIGFKNIELLLCDDCSTDGSYEIARKLSDRYKNVKLLKTEEKCGPGGPRNMGIEASTAEYIMFLDSDDEYYPDACRILLGEIENSTDLDIVQGRMFAKASTESAFQNEYLNTPEPDIIGEYELGGRNPNKAAFFFRAGFWAKIYRRSVIEEFEIRFPEGVMFEDKSFVFQFMLCCSRGKIIPNAVYLYHIIGDSISHSQQFLALKTMASAIMQAIDFSEKQGKKEQMLGMISAHHAHTDHFTMMLNEGYSKEQKTVLINEWKPIFNLIKNGELACDFPYLNLVSSSAITKSEENAVLDFCAVEKMWLNNKHIIEQFRKERKTQVDEIYGSTTWKIASALQKLKFWSK